MFLKRLDEIRPLFEKQKLNAVLISEVSSITYLTGFSNFSETEREAYIFIGKDFAYIITDGRYSEAIKKEVPHLTLFERGSQKIEDLFEKHIDVKKLGIEENNLTVSEYKFFKKHFKKLKGFQIDQRIIKTKEEIQKIRKAAQLGDLAFDYILEKLKPGISEKELAFEIELFVKKHEAELSFPPIIAFSKNSAIPHHQTGKTILYPSTRTGQEGVIILLDFGVKIDNYCSDMTRTVFFGEPNDAQKKIYETVLEAQRKAADFINKSLKSSKGVKASSVDRVAREHIIAKKYPTIPHSLGHGIGLRVHEHPSLSPKSKDVLKEGMVFSIEPGIYLPDLGSPRSTRVEAGGVRIEDLYAIEGNELRQLTNSPKNLIVVY